MVDTGRRDKAIEALVLSCNCSKCVVDFRVITDINANILQGSAILICSFLLGFDKIRVWGFEAIQSVNLGMVLV